jgi:hypothetical protein
MSLGAVERQSRCDREGKSRNFATFTSEFFRCDSSRSHQANTAHSANAVCEGKRAGENTSSPWRDFLSRSSTKLGALDESPLTLAESTEPPSSHAVSIYVREEVKQNCTMSEEWYFDLKKLLISQNLIALRSSLHLPLPAL